MHTKSESAIGKIAQAIAHIPEYKKFHEYCLMKEEGFTRMSTVPLTQFINEAKTWPLEKRIEFFTTLQLLFTQHNGYDANPYPLEANLKMPMLEEWMEKEPYNPAPFSWYGSETGSMSHIKKALSLDPYHQQSLLTIIQRYLGHLWTGSCHLPDYYVGNAERDLALAEKTQGYISKLNIEHLKVQLQKELNKSTVLLQNYLDFKHSSIESFSLWGKLNHKDFSPDRQTTELV
ncbi:MAG: hypothetical protein CL868_09265 [Cytophagaceae bacterium]|nr:hypothetical protein [Cytophagaceae bacterium]|tara:strand:- start:1144 stop:1839 length:696 start_codon:yes stop_codon:yes gene_type:complete